MNENSKEEFFSKSDVKREINMQEDIGELVERLTSSITYTDSIINPQAAYIFKTRIQQILQFYQTCQSSRSIPEFEQQIKRSLLSEEIQYKRKLPIYLHKLEILSTIKANDVVIVKAETGAGKTSQLPVYLAYDYELKYSLSNTNFPVICTQPRKLSNIVATEQIRKEFNIELGERGIQSLLFSYESMHKLGGEIIMVNEQTLFQNLVLDKDLHFENYKLLILDEAHERTIPLEIILGILKAYTLKQGNMKLVIMSATIDLPKLKEFFSGYSVALVDCPVGREHKVEYIYSSISIGNNYYPETLKVAKKVIEEALEKLRREERDEMGWNTEEMGCNISNTPNTPNTPNIQNIQNKQSELPPTETILIFLPDIQSIKSLRFALESRFQSSISQVCILPLHSQIPPREQRAIVECRARRIKVIISTNVAETSLTIRHVSTVIDSGTHKYKVYNQTGETAHLERGRITKGQAAQRAGRAGRERPGVCYRVYSLLEYGQMEDFPVSQLFALNIGSVLLALANYGIEHISLLPLLDCPGALRVDAAYLKLRELGAIDNGQGVASGKGAYSLTHLGHMLAQLGGDPSLGAVAYHAWIEGGGVREILCITSHIMTGLPIFRTGGAYRERGFFSPAKPYDIVDPIDDIVDPIDPLDPDTHLLPSSPPTDSEHTIYDSPTPVIRDQLFRDLSQGIFASTSYLSHPLLLSMGDQIVSLFVFRQYAQIKCVRCVQSERKGGFCMGCEGAKGRWCKVFGLNRKALALSSRLFNEQLALFSKYVLSTQSYANTQESQSAHSLFDDVEVTWKERKGTVWELEKIIANYASLAYAALLTQKQWASRKGNHPQGMHKTSYVEDKYLRHLLFKSRNQIDLLEIFERLLEIYSTLEESITCAFMRVYSLNICSRLELSSCPIEILSRSNPGSRTHNQQYNEEDMRGIEEAQKTLKSNIIDLGYFNISNMKCMRIAEGSVYQRLHILQRDHAFNSYNTRLEHQKERWGAGAPVLIMYTKEDVDKAMGISRIKKEWIPDFPDAEREYRGSMATLQSMVQYIVPHCGPSLLRELLGERARGGQWTCVRGKEEQFERELGVRPVSIYPSYFHHTLSLFLPRQRGGRGIGDVINQRVEESEAVVRVHRTVITNYEESGLLLEVGGGGCVQAVGIPSPFLRGIIASNHLDQSEDLETMRLPVARPLNRDPEKLYFRGMAQFNLAKEFLHSRGHLLLPSPYHREITYHMLKGTYANYWVLFHTTLNPIPIPHSPHIVDDHAQPYSNQKELLGKYLSLKYGAICTLDIVPHTADHGALVKVLFMSNHSEESLWADLGSDPCLLSTWTNAYRGVNHQEIQLPEVRSTEGERVLNLLLSLARDMGARYGVNIHIKPRTIEIGSSNSQLLLSLNDLLSEENILFPSNSLLRHLQQIPHPKSRYFDDASVQEFACKLNCYMYFSILNSSVRILGPPGERGKLKRRITKYILDFTAHSEYKCLDVGRFPRRYIRVIIDYLREGAFREGALEILYDATFQYLGIWGIRYYVAQFIKLLLSNYNDLRYNNNIMPPLTPTVKCRICMCNVKSIEQQTLGMCGHSFCRGCIKQQIVAALNVYPTAQLPLKCIVCATQFLDTDWQVEGSYSLYSNIFYKSVRNMLNAAHAGNLIVLGNGINFCSYPNCKGIYHTEMLTSMQLTRFCFACRHTLCLLCGRNALSRRHISEGCKKSIMKEMESSDREWLRKHTVGCPRCKIRYNRGEGCNHMVCFSCIPPTHFCYRCSQCLDPLNPYSHFNNLLSLCNGALYEKEKLGEEEVSDERGDEDEEENEEIELEVGNGIWEGEKEEMEEEKEEYATCEQLERWGASSNPSEEYKMPPHIFSYTGQEFPQLEEKEKLPVEQKEKELDPRSQPFKSRRLIISQNVKTTPLPREPPNEHLEYIGNAKNINNRNMKQEVHLPQEMNIPINQLFGNSTYNANNFNSGELVEEEKEFVEEKVFKEENSNQLNRSPQIEELKEDHPFSLNRINHQQNKHLVEYTEETKKKKKITHCPKCKGEVKKSKYKNDLHCNRCDRYFCYLCKMRFKDTSNNIEELLQTHFSTTLCFNGKLQHSKRKILEQIIIWKTKIGF